MTATMLAPRIIDTPGVYDLPDAIYHLDPVPGGSLSNSGAEHLLPPGCPALYRYKADHPEPSKRHYDIGSAVHRLFLGAGPEIRVIDADDYRGKVAQTERKAAYAAGEVPLLRDEYAEAQAMTAALRADPYAAALFNPATGRPEQSLFWVDGEFGVWRRARLDWMTAARTGRTIFADLKTAQSAAPEHLAKAIYNNGYFRQAAYYLDGIAALGLADEATFVFVAVEKTPPYLITVFDLDDEDLALGRELNRQAVETFARCQATGEWPGYTQGVTRIAMPGWARRRHEVEW